MKLKKLLIFAVIALLSVSVISACNTSSPAVELPPRFASYLGDGLTFVATPGQDGDEVFLELSFETDGWKYKGAYRSDEMSVVLVNKTTQERVEALDSPLTFEALSEMADRGESDESRRLFQEKYRNKILFPIKLEDFQQYSIEYKATALLVLNDVIELNIPLPELGKVDVRKHKEFPDGHFITVHDVEVVASDSFDVDWEDDGKDVDIKAASSHSRIAAISCTASENFIYSLDVYDSKGGARVHSFGGLFLKPQNVFYASVLDNAKELYIEFAGINYYKDFQGTAELILA
ncbi:MAG: hypothetical protein FWG82_00325 [Oscillospiraceae bacterium]|nr:hypothetical protein [Oscillospiraceae bacterium]